MPFNEHASLFSSLCRVGFLNAKQLRAEDHYWWYTTRYDLAWEQWNTGISERLVTGAGPMRAIDTKLIGSNTEVDRLSGAYADENVELFERNPNWRCWIFEFCGKRFGGLFFEFNNEDGVIILRDTFIPLELLMDGRILLVIARELRDHVYEHRYSKLVFRLRRYFVKRFKPLLRLVKAKRDARMDKYYVPQDGIACITFSTLTTDLIAVAAGKAND